MRDVKLGKQSLQDAVSEYERDVLERGGQEVLTSRSQTFFTHDFNNFLKNSVPTPGNGPNGN